MREIMRRAIDARLLGGGAAEMAEHFFGLLWGSRMLGLLLNIAERPGAKEITARAEGRHPLSCCLSGTGGKR